MQMFRFYHLKGGHFTKSELIEASDDQIAIEAARGRGVEAWELWLDARLVQASDTVRKVAAATGEGGASAN